MHVKQFSCSSMMLRDHVSHPQNTSDRMPFPFSSTVFQDVNKMVNMMFSLKKHMRRSLDTPTYNSTNSMIFILNRPICIPTTNLWYPQSLGTKGLIYLLIRLCFTYASLMLDSKKNETSRCISVLYVKVRILVRVHFLVLRLKFIFINFIPLYDIPNYIFCMSQIISH
jgi:hypothetical protein